MLQNTICVSLVPRPEEAEEENGPGLSRFVQALITVEFHRFRIFETRPTTPDVITILQCFFRRRRRRSGRSGFGRTTFNLIIFIIIHVLYLNGYLVQGYECLFYRTVFSVKLSKCLTSSLLERKLVNALTPFAFLHGCKYTKPHPHVI